MAYRVAGWGRGGGDYVRPIVCIDQGKYVNGTQPVEVEHSEKLRISYRSGPGRGGGRGGGENQRPGSQ